MAGKTIKNMEEADGRVILHIQDMACSGWKTVMLCTSDTDVVILALSYFQMFNSLGLTELWIQFGAGKNLKYIPIHSLCLKLKQQTTDGLL